MAGLLLGFPPHVHRQITASHLSPSAHVFNCIPVLHLSLSIPLPSCLPHLLPLTSTSSFSLSHPSFHPPDPFLSLVPHLPVPRAHPLLPYHHPPHTHTHPHPSRWSLRLLLLLLHNIAPQCVDVIITQHLPLLWNTDEHQEQGNKGTGKQQGV